MYVYVHVARFAVSMCSEAMHYSVHVGTISEHGQRFITLVDVFTKKENEASFDSYCNMVSMASMCN